MTDHTPGPWRAEVISDADGFRDRVVAGARIISRSPARDEPENAEAQANAQLMAAAPAMLNDPVPPPRDMTAVRASSRLLMGDSVTIGPAGPWPVEPTRTRRTWRD